MVTKRAHISELEQQHKALEDEIAEALLHTFTDDLKIVELKSQIAPERRDRTAS